MLRAFRWFHTLDVIMAKKVGKLVNKIPTARNATGIVYRNSYMLLYNAKQGIIGSNGTQELFAVSALFREFRL